ncbi:hypothetical protein FRC08_015513 [Ceratobasidium sp. 394]|nr:hypothetical protein FRC08_015513 [Ceratobasidium sp. 394]KAG9075819.1 hypothetical protein FS749_012475 [Ceratobasidium sp. UAMH 11750]
MPSVTLALTHNNVVQGLPSRLPSNGAPTFAPSSGSSGSPSKSTSMRVSSALLSIPPPLESAPT